MTTAKIRFVYVALAVFLASSIVGILGIIGCIPIASNGSAAALITPVFGIIVALLNAKHVFNDPEAVAKLKEEHHDSMLELKRIHVEEKTSLKLAHDEAMAKLVQAEQNTIADIDQRHAEEMAQALNRHAQERQTDAATIQNLKGVNAELSTQVKKLTPDAPGRMYPAPGSARTRP